MTTSMVAIGLAAFGAALSAPAAAAQPVPQDGFDPYCSLRQADGTGLRLVPGALEQWVVFAGPAGRLPNGEELDLLVQPGGTRTTGKARVNREGGRADGMMIHPRAFDVLQALGTGGTVQVMRRGRIVAEARFDRAALAEIGACADRRLRRWGVDMDARAGLRSLPQLLPGPALLTTADYPDSLAARRGGASVLRFTIGADGRIDTCDVAQSSGAADLDAAGCRGWRLRAHYSPAVGADGRPVAVQLIQLVQWAPNLRGN